MYFKLMAQMRKKSFNLILMNHEHFILILHNLIFNFRTNYFRSFTGQQIRSIVGLLFYRIY